MFRNTPLATPFAPLPMAPGYMPGGPNPFGFEPLDPGLNMNNRERIIAEQQRIIAVFSDFFTAQKLRWAGHGDANIPQFVNEQSNKDQIQGFIKDLATHNIEKMSMITAMNGFGTNLLDVHQQKRIVENQRIINEWNRSALQNFSGFQQSSRNYARGARFFLIPAFLGIAWLPFAIWTLATADNLSSPSGSAGLYQCALVGTFTGIALSTRLIWRWCAGRNNLTAKNEIAVGDGVLRSGTSFAFDIIILIALISWAITFGLIGSNKKRALGEQETEAANMSSNTSAPPGAALVDAIEKATAPVAKTVYRTIATITAQAPAPTLDRTLKSGLQDINGALNRILTTTRGQ